MSDVRVHELKTWPKQFDDLVAGLKGFELRFDDRGFRVGDYLILFRYDPATHAMTGEVIVSRVVYVMRSTDGPFGLLPGWVAMSLAPVDEARAAAFLDAWAGHVKRGQA